MSFNTVLKFLWIGCLILVVWATPGLAEEPSERLKDFVCRVPDFAPIDTAGIWMYALKNTDKGYRVRVRYSHAQILKGRAKNADELFLPYLEKGDIVPLVGFVYRVAETGSAGVRFQWIPNKELPDGLQAVQPDSLILPGGMPEEIGYTSFQNVGSLSLAAIARKKENGREMLQATLELRGGDLMGTATVKVGDIIIVGDEGGFVVRSIVPRNEKTKVIGWVELSSKPIPEADLIKEKKPYYKLGGKKKE